MPDIKPVAPIALPRFTAGIVPELRFWYAGDWHRFAYNQAVSDYEEKLKFGDAAFRATERFFQREDAVYQTLRDVTARLEKLGVAYAVVGGMALVAHGYIRTTIDVDILVTADGLRALHAALDGLGYLPPFEGSKNLRDTATGVRIEFLIAGQFPGDGKPKPVAFPDPAVAAETKHGIRFLSLPKLIELKLASGMTNPGRLRDLADVQELIRTLKLPRDFDLQLNEFVRTKFRDLYQALSASG